MCLCVQKFCTIKSDTFGIILGIWVYCVLGYNTSLNYLNGLFLLEQMKHRVTFILVPITCGASFSMLFVKSFLNLQLKPDLSTLSF